MLSHMMGRLLAIGLITQFALLVVHAESHEEIKGSRNVLTKHRLHNTHDRGLQQNSTSPSNLPSSIPVPSSSPTVDMKNGTTTIFPTSLPTSTSTSIPSIGPTVIGSTPPTDSSSAAPTSSPSSTPTSSHSSPPTSSPSSSPTSKPSIQPTTMPSSIPSTSSSPSFLPTNIPSTSPSISISPSNLPSNSAHPSNEPTGLPSWPPSDQPSTQPTFTPSSPPSAQPSPSPSNTASNRPSESPSFGIVKVVTDPAEIIFESLGGKLEGTKLSDYWRDETSNFIMNYWNSKTNDTDYKYKYSFTNVDTFIEKQKFIKGRRRMQDSSLRNVRGRNLGLSASRLRILFTQEYSFHGLEDGFTDDDEVYTIPLQDPNYIATLRSNDNSENQFFNNVTLISVRMMTETEAPSFAPPTTSPLSDEPINKMTEGDSYVPEILISIGSVCGAIALYYFCGRNTTCSKNSANEHDGEDSVQVVPGATARAVLSTSAKFSSPIEIEQSMPFFEAKENVIIENSLSLVEKVGSSVPANEDDSGSGSGSEGNSSAGKIDLSVYTNEAGDAIGDSEDPRFSIQGDSEFEDSDSMLSFDVYSSTDDEGGKSSNELIVVPKGSPKPENVIKTEIPLKQDNLVVTGAPLSPSKSDGPTIGTTTVIEGTGSFEGIHMMTVGDIDDMDGSSPLPSP